MATELEQTLDIEDFFGIDRQVLPEDVNPKGFLTLQNLFERKIGELQKIGGSTNLLNDFPSNITAIDRGFRLYDRDFSKYRLLAVKCAPAADPETIVSDAYANSITVEYINPGSGNWNKLSAGIYTGTLEDSGGADSGAGLILQFIGYGVNICHAYHPDASIITNGTLQITIPSGFNENITGINIYSTTVADSEPAGLGYDIYSPVWAGYIDLIANPTGGVFTFSQAPRFIPGTFTTPAAWPGASFDIGGTLPTFDLEGTTGGSLEPGKKYYVAVLSQRLKSNNDQNVANTSNNDIARWEGIGVSVGTVQSITLGLDQNAINVDNIAGTSAAYAIAIGTDPELLTMQFVTNTVNNTVTQFVKSPNVVGKKTAATTLDLIFIAPDYSLQDNLIQVNDNGSFYPIYISRMSNLNTDSFTFPWQSNQGGGQTPRLPFVQRNIFDDVNFTPSISSGNGSKFRFTQLQSLAFFVNDSEKTSVESFSGSGISASVGVLNISGYYQTDGLVAGGVIFDFGTSPVPKSKFIATYQESIVLGGGSKASESYSTFFWSNALNPNNFAQGGTGLLLNFISVDPNGEPINNIGIYTFTTGTDNPTSQLLITKPSSSWSLSNLPTDFTDRTIMTNLSKRVGQIGDTVVVTAVGTIWASRDNVYILDPNGEPAPIGDSIEPILRAANLDNAVACFHNNQYKLCFRSAAGSGPNDTQIWLDIRKMKASKGTPFWMGPHVGRNISYTWSEFQNDDTEERFVVDQSNMQLYQTDIDDQNLHLGSNISIDMLSPEYKMEPASLTNKLLNRFYLKLKVMRTTSFDMTATVMTPDGPVSESQTLSVAPPANAAWSQASFDYNLFVNAWHKEYPFFYTSRLVGRTIQKRIQHTGTDNVSISGISVNFKIEKRRL